MTRRVWQAALVVLLGSQLAGGCSPRQVNIQVLRTHCPGVQRLEFYLLRLTANELCILSSDGSTADSGRFHLQASGIGSGSARVLGLALALTQPQAMEAGSSIMGAQADQGPVCNFNGACDKAAGETCASCPVDCCPDGGSGTPDSGYQPDSGNQPDTGSPVDTGPQDTGPQDSPWDRDLDGAASPASCVKCYALMELVLDDSQQQVLTLRPTTSCVRPPLKLSQLGAETTWKSLPGGELPPAARCSGQ